MRVHAIFFHTDIGPDVLNVHDNGNWLVAHGHRCVCVCVSMYYPRMRILRIDFHRSKESKSAAEPFNFPVPAKTWFGSKGKSDEIFDLLTVTVCLTGRWYKPPNELRFLLYILFWHSIRELDRGHRTDTHTHTHTPTNRAGELLWENDWLCSIGFACVYTSNEKNNKRGKNEKQKDAKNEKKNGPRGISRL